MKNDTVNSRCVAPHLLQVDDQPNVVLKHLLYKTMLLYILMPRPCHGQHMVSNPVAVKALDCIGAFLFGWVFTCAALATFADTLHALLYKEAPVSAYGIVLCLSNGRCLGALLIQASHCHLETSGKASAESPRTSLPSPPRTSTQLLH